MKLGMLLGVGPGHIVLAGDPAPLPIKGYNSRIFGQYLLRRNGCMIKMSLGMELGLGPSDFVLDGDPVPLPERGNGALPPNSRPMFIVAKRLHG